MEDSPYDADSTANSQLLQKFCYKTDYLYASDSTNKKCDHVIDHALQNKKSYESTFTKFGHFQLIVNFLIPKERDSNCLHEVILKTIRIPPGLPGVSSNLRPTYYSQPPFIPITPPVPVLLSTSSSSCTDTTPILSPLSSNIPDTPSPIIDDQLRNTISMISSNTGADLGGGGGFGRPLLRDSTPCRPKGSPL